MKNNLVNKGNDINFNANPINDFLDNDNLPYSALEKKISYNSYSYLCGVIPPSKDYLTTTANMYNKEIEKLISNKNGKDEFYQKEKAFLKAETEYLKNNTKRDHIKKIFATLNFKSKGTTYNDTFYFDKDKEKETNEQDFSNHYKKSFMKTYEEIKQKHTSLVRK